jgi:hypothetical protein
MQTRLSNYCHKLFVSNLAIEPRFLPRQPENPRSRNCQWSIKYKPTRKSPCLFVYRGTVCAICRTPNNRGIFLSPPVREPAIPKVAKYGMTSVHCFAEQFRLMQPQHCKLISFIMHFHTWPFLPCLLFLVPVTFAYLHNKK